MSVETEVIDIVALDSQGRGVGRSMCHMLAAHDVKVPDSTLGKVVFIEGALLNERVQYRVLKSKRKYIEGQLLHIAHASSQRIVPRCRYFSACGGCAMQHLNSQGQLAIKQRQLENNLLHIGKVRAQQILRPIAGVDWGYRHRARLSVYYDAGRGNVRIGFHEKKSRHIVDMQTCEILPPHISALLPALRQLIASLSLRARIPQIELALSNTLNIFVLRILDELSEEDKNQLRLFADTHHVQFWLQPNGSDSISCFYPPHPQLHYTLPEFGVTLAFLPTDFTQVNPQMNQILVGQALKLLQVQAHECVLDLFCGIGNFTLPLATQASKTLGIEGSAALCERAQHNAVHNQLAHKVRFMSQNLFEIDMQHIMQWGKFDRWLLDPPRDGALALVRALAVMKLNHPEFLPKRLVYVSCDPATLARDAAILVTQVGYRLSAAGVVNMFPHTTHIESLAVFDL